jgi:hypothetical protein
MKRPWLAACVLLLVPLAGALAPSAPGTSEPMLERVAVLGASASDGFGLRQEAGRKLRLTDVFEAALPTSSELTHAATGMFFMNPERNGQRMADRALAAKPTLVIAVDFLFWHGYGALGSQARRLALLETGLAHLDRFDCPIVVGDFPDCHAALEGVGPLGGPIIAPSQVPARATLDALNARLQAWLEANPRATLVPLSTFVAKVHAGEPFEVAGQRFEGDELGDLLQRDLLHPTVDGTIALAHLALERLVAARPELAEAAIEWQPQVIREAVVVAAEPVEASAR